MSLEHISKVWVLFVGQILKSELISLILVLSERLPALVFRTKDQVKYHREDDDNAVARAGISMAPFVETNMEHH